MKASPKPAVSRKTILFAALLLGLVVILLLLAYFVGRKLDVVPEGAGLAPSRDRELQTTEIPDIEDLADSEGSETVDALYYNGHAYTYNGDLYTVLILGIDDEELIANESIRNQSLADLILVAAFDPAAETCTVIQINRDTMSDVPLLDTFGNLIGLRNEQIALAHTYGDALEGSCENTVNAVSRFLYGVTIDNYFSLTMDAIPVLTDLVGGVTVTVQDDFTGVDDTLIQGETVTLTSTNAEHFVRSRTNMPQNKTNLNRMERQKEYLYSFLESLREELSQDPDFVVHAYSAVADALVTDCTINELSDLASRFSEYQLSKIVSPEGEAVEGEQFMEFYVDEAALQKLVIDTFYLPVE